MNIYEIRKLCAFEEVDYLKLKQILNNYAQIRNKIQGFIKAKELIRIKKGLYIFGQKVSLGPYSKEHLANLIFGPSAISFEYALSLYNMIPERVEEVTSITIKRNKLFVTPIGRFSYHFISPKKYSIGMTQISLHKRNILIASKEKALCDILAFKTNNLKNQKELQDHLFENLRIEKDDIQSLNFKLLETINKHYKNNNVNLLYIFVKENHEKSN